MRVIGHERPALPKRKVYSGPARKSREVTITKIRVFRFVQIVFYTSAYLELDTLKPDLFQTEDRKRLLPDLPLYELLRAVNFILAVEALETETARQSSVLCLLEQRAVRERLVVKDGADLVYALEALDLFMPVVGVIEVVLDAADEWIDKILKATRNTRIVPPRTNIYLFLDDRKYSFVDRLFLEDRGKRNSVAP